MKKVLYLVSETIAAAVCFYQITGFVSVDVSPARSTLQNIILILCLIGFVFFGARAIVRIAFWGWD